MRARAHAPGRTYVQLAYANSRARKKGGLLRRFLCLSLRFGFARGFVALDFLRLCGFGGFGFLRLFRQLEGVVRSGGVAVIGFAVTRASRHLERDDHEGFVAIAVHARNRKLI